MNTIEKIRAEIERLENYYTSVEWYVEALLSFLDTIEERVPEIKETGTQGLDEAAENYIAPIENDAGLDFINFSGRDIRDAFIAGAEWQKQHDAELIEIAYNDGITIGMTKQKEQMMKDAVEGRIYGCDGLWVESRIDARIQGKEGDKVKLIIIKEDKK